MAKCPTSWKLSSPGSLNSVLPRVFSAAFCPVLAALGAGLAITGSLLGPLLFFIGINLCRALTRWYGFKYGYQKGTEIVGDMSGGRLQKVTQGASILGLFIMGSLVSKWTSINIPFELSRYVNQEGKEVVTTVQSVLNDLLPGLMALLLTFVCMWLLHKKVNAMVIIFGLFGVGILGYWLGILA